MQVGPHSPTVSKQTRAKFNAGFLLMRAYARAKTVTMRER